MQPLNIFQQLFNFIFKKESSFVSIFVKEGESWVFKEVPAPVTFTWLDEEFGEGNWSL